MPDATLDPNVLLDDLVGLADELRQDLAVGFGLRQFRVYLVRRTWDNGLVGEGEYTEGRTELVPRPVVVPYAPGMEHKMDPAGMDEQGVVWLKEVSLTYTEAELTGGHQPHDDLEGQELFYELVDGNGQELEARRFILDAPPFPDREKDIGWVVKLRRVGAGA